MGLVAPATLSSFWLVKVAPCPGQSVTHDQLGIAAEFDHDAIAYAELRGLRWYGYALQ